MQKIATINGEKIAYSDVGKGQPIVCVHGWAMHKGMFSKLADSISAQFRIISLDLPGHGDSKSTLDPYTIERAGDALFALCSKLDLKNIIALGWSMGAHVWWDLIARHGEQRLAGLVIEDMSPKVYNTSTWKRGTLNGRTLDGIEEMLVEMQQDWTTFSYRFVPRIFAKGLGGKWAKIAERTMRDTLKNNPEIMADYWRSMAGQDFRSLLPKLTIPTLIAHGRLSQLYGKNVATYLQDNIPHSDLIGFAQSGHAPHLEQPELFTEMLANFAAKTQTAAQSQPRGQITTQGDHHVQI